MKTTHRPGCATPNIPRQSQPCFNPPPGSSPEAAAAAKKDVAARESAIKSAINAVVKMLPTPAPQPANQSAAALADKKDQASKLKDYR